MIIPESKKNVKKVAKNKAKTVENPNEIRKIDTDLVIEIEEIAGEKPEEKHTPEEKISEKKKVILLREDGILKIWSEKDIKKTDWQYRIQDATENFMLIDIDHGKAQPLVKSILNELDLFPELRMLRKIQFSLYVVGLLLFITWLWGIVRSPTKLQVEEMGKTMAETKAETIKKTADPAEKVRQMLQYNTGAAWTAK